MSISSKKDWLGNMSEGRALPQNVECETGLLGIIMERNDVLHTVTGIIAKSDFYEVAFGELFTLMRDLIETGREAKPVTLMHDLSQNADVGGITTIELLNKLQREAPHESMARQFAMTIRDLSMRRRDIELTTKHLDELYSAPATVTAVEIEARYNADRATIYQRAQDIGLTPVAEIGDKIVNDVQEELRRQAADEQAAKTGAPNVIRRARGWSSGLKAFDDLNGLILPGRTYVLTGASGSGKTALAWQVASTVAKVVPVAFRSIEMDGSELVTRDMSAETGVSAGQIERASMTEDEFYRLDDYVRAARSLPNLFVDSAKSPTVGSIRGQCMRMKRMKGLGLLVVDHLRYIKHPDRRLDIFEAMHDNLQGLNAIADDVGIAVMVLCQLKSSYGNDAKIGQPIREPNVGDIFNGAVIEQEADNLTILHREEYMLARRRPNDSDGEALAKWRARMDQVMGRARLLQNKRRNGPGYGERDIGFDANTQRFSDTLPPVGYVAQSMMF